MHELTKRPEVHSQEQRASPETILKATDSDLPRKERARLTANFTGDSLDGG